MTESIVKQSQETFEDHANHERIPVQIYLDSSEACQVIGDEIIQQINQRSADQAFVLGWLLDPLQLRCINTLFVPIKLVK